MGEVNVLWIVLDERVQCVTSGGVFLKLDLRQSQIELPERDLLVLRIVSLKLAKRLFRLEPAFGFVEPSCKVVGIQPCVGANVVRLNERRYGYGAQQYEINEVGRLRRISCEHVSLLRLRRQSVNVRL